MTKTMNMNTVAGQGNRRPMTPAELAANGPYSESTLANRRSQGLPPEAYRIGRRVFYDPDVVDAWLAAERTKSERNAP